MDPLSILLALAIGVGGASTPPSDTNIRSTIIDTGSGAPVPPPETLDIRSTIIDTGAQ